MNFFRGTVHDGRVVLEGSWIGVGTPALERHDVVLGVRPTALREAASGSLSVRVSSVEPLGEFVDVVGETGPARVTARLPARDGLQAGDTLRLEATRVFVFEPGEFGTRLLPLMP
jgi:ABC-type sugar transport system ATPase subunit